MNINKDVLSKFDNNYFIETGSYIGDGIQTALDAGFKNVISIDITPQYYDICKNRFKDNSNVTILFGDSVKVLPALLQDINEPVTILLDAHYIDTTTNYGDKMCPVLDELDIIKTHAEKFNDIILIDDMRCWTDTNWNQVNYQFNNEDIKNKIKDFESHSEISFIDGVIPNDVLVARFFVKEVEETPTPIAKLTPIAKPISKVKTKRSK